MGELNLLIEGIEAQCQSVLSEKGRLTTALPGFVPRNAQIDMATAIANAIEHSSTLVCEAGTGTGKTFAYLIPCLVSGKKSIISTATKTLQDQLFSRDIPQLLHALGVSRVVQNLKGRENYICRYRVKLHTEQAAFKQKTDAQALQLIQSRIPKLKDGMRSELPEIEEQSTVWPFATSTADNCLGNECAFYNECFIVKARQKAMKADIVVINHHLFFADSKLKDTGFGELLPGVDAVVFDEAHHLVDIATQFYSRQFSTRQLGLIFNDLAQEWPITDLSYQPFKNIRITFEKIVDMLLLALPAKEDKFTWDAAMRHNRFKDAWQKLLDLIGECFEVLEKYDDPEEKGLKRCHEQLKEIIQLANLFEGKTAGAIAWLEKHVRSLVFHQTPFDIAKDFSQILDRQQVSFIFTSATLTIADSFDCFMKPLGIKDSKTLIFPSPFDYEKQSLLYLPRYLPDPKHSQYYNELVNQVIPMIEACKGRCFFLFTSHRALNLVGTLLEKRVSYPLLIQGQESKPILLARFREYGNAVLLGTSTFWEGVDVKGQALCCVIIDKLPFANPSDPIMRGKMAYVRQQGLSDFDVLSLPNAVLGLKQGVGRLIRDVNDKGILIVADPRLTGRAYGKTIFASLPKATRTRDRAKALAFIEELL